MGDPPVLVSGPLGLPNRTMRPCRPYGRPGQSHRSRSAARMADADAPESSTGRAGCLRRQRAFVATERGPSGEREQTATRVPRRQDRLCRLAVGAAPWGSSRVGSARDCACVCARERGDRGASKEAASAACVTVWNVRACGPSGPGAIEAQCRLNSPSGAGSATAYSPVLRARDSLCRQGGLVRASRKPTIGARSPRTTVGTAEPGQGRTIERQLAVFGEAASRRLGGGTVPTERPERSGQLFAVWTAALLPYSAQACRSRGSPDYRRPCSCDSSRRGRTSAVALPPVEALSPATDGGWRRFCHDEWTRRAGPSAASRRGRPGPRGRLAWLLPVLRLLCTECVTLRHGRRRRAGPSRRLAARTGPRRRPGRLAGTPALVLGRMSGLTEPAPPTSRQTDHRGAARNRGGRQ